MKKGFTLIELLVVIAIVGVLAAAILVAINPAERIAEARDSQIKNDIGSIATGLTTYFTRNQDYPAPDSTPPCVTSADNGLCSLAQPTGDLKTVPSPPAAGPATMVVGSCAAGVRAYDCGYARAVVSGANEVSAEYPMFAISNSGNGTGTGNVWCYRSVTGQANSTFTAAACTPS